MTQCIAKNCTAIADAARGLCHRHYARWRRNGHTQLTNGKGCKDPIERFELQTKRAKNGCLEWTGAMSANGYGSTMWDYKPYSAHRFAWELFNGPIPDGLSVCHKCDNKKCVDVSHLFLGTPKENTQDACKKLKMTYGSKVWCAKLDEKTVIEIQNSKIDAREIAKSLGVSASTVYRARNADTWKHLSAANRRKGE